MDVMSETNPVLFDGMFFQAVDIGNRGGRYAVIRKGDIGVVLMTALNPRIESAEELAIMTAKALDEAEKVRQGVPPPAPPAPPRTPTLWDRLRGK